MLVAHLALQVEVNLMQQGRLPEPARKELEALVQVRTLEGPPA
jgi:hypothetical protein